ncbi:MAG: hypothetical protein JXR37_26205 [Kiritimatiellae bacterium]|nr:hypothetical protein [Kiritimatiellia bacterium]
MNDSFDEQGKTRVLSPILIGLAGAVFIWFITPYNNFVLGNAYISDDFMPVAALFVVLVLVLGVNPLLRRLAPGAALNAGQMGIVFGILLIASVTPSQGLLRELPYSLAGAAARVSEDSGLADAYAKLKPPPSLFPDTLGYGQDAPASQSFLGELGPGERIPWGAWLAPLFAWSGFLLPWWIMMTALALIVLPQWRDNERQPFPLWEVQRALIEDPQDSGRVAPLFRNGGFWTAVGIVFCLHLLAGGQWYAPERVPAIPLRWDLSACFTEEPFRYLPWYIKSNRIHFMFLGMAFFMPKRVGFSIWFFQLAYALLIMVRQAYYPPFHYGMISDHRIGAWLAVPLGVMWLGRRHWQHVFRCVFRGAAHAADRRDRLAGIAFLGGCLGMFAWLMWVRVNAVWAVALIVLSVLYALGLTRIVAETGLPLMAPDTHYVLTLARLVPVAWRTAASMYWSGIVGFWIGHGNRLCVTTFMVHALGLDKDACPRKHVRLAGLLVGVLALSLIVCGAAHLLASYHHAETLDGRQQPISSWGTRCFAWTGESLLREWKAGQATQVAPYNRAGHIVFGAALAGLLQYLCQASPSWPLHPVALLFVGNWYAHRVWISVLIGWLAKVLILRYGGSRLYHRARAVFVGLVIGEVVAMAFWVGVTIVIAALGLPYRQVDILPF